MRDCGRSFAGGMPRPNWIRDGAFLSLAIVLLFLTGCNWQAMEDQREFNVEEGLAKKTLKEAARQAEVEFIFSSDLIKDLHTPALKGRYSPSDAFQIMLADSPFMVVQHEASGVYSIQRKSPPDPE